MTHSWNGAAAKVLSEKVYDALGRLYTDKKGGMDNLKTTYSYDIRSRLTNQAESHYSQTLAYTYGSNIQSQKGSMPLPGVSEQEFTYDGLSRLTQAKHLIPYGYNANYTYDKNGNMTLIAHMDLTRQGMYEYIDYVTINLNGNQLLNASDPMSSFTSKTDFKDYANQTVEYTYNKNGALIQDLNKGISSIQYNILNLPDRIDMKNPVCEARNEYIYRSDGNKLRARHRWNPNFSSAPIIGSGVTESSLTSAETTDYIDNYVYVNNALKKILTENGYIENNAYFFYVTDHLGSIRAIADASATCKLTVGYFPFGMQYGDAISTEVQPYKYTAKEYDQMHGLNLYDSKARFYDPALARFTSMDPLAEKYYAWSSYTYGLNNPLRFTDPTGMFSEDKNKNMEIEKELLINKYGQNLIDKYHIISEFNLLTRKEKKNSNEFKIFNHSIKSKK